MTNWIIAAGYSISGAMLIMMMIGIAFSAFMPSLDRWNRKYFVTFFSILLMYAVVLLIDLIIYTNPGIVAEQRVIIIIEYLFFSVLMPMPMPFLLHCCGESPKNSVPLRTVIMLWGIFCIILCVSQFTDVFYYIAQDNQYARAPLFLLMIAPLSLIMIINTVSLIVRRKKLSKRVFIALLVYLLPTVILVILYMVAAVDTVVSFWMALCAITMFILILSDSMEQYMQQQREIANQRAGIMVLQMRPHFIYNTMMGIYYLCKQDPDKAQQVTLDFTTYLRRNFAAIASENTVPFKNELEHTRAYLAVEQAQFEDRLFVSFDTPHTMFRVPPLTLQPLVENAVKHGMNPDGDPLNISVMTRQTKGGSEIIVEDDGSGFNSADDKEPHIALNNIKQRLEIMCKGKLEISQREGGGTSVKVTIPVSDKCSG